MAEEGISQDQRGKEPVAPVHEEVVVHLVPDVGPSQVALVIVRVHVLSDFLVQHGI